MEEDLTYMLNVFDVEILSYSLENNYYTVKYSILNDNGVIRRSKAIFKDGQLSRDKTNTKLLEEINYKVKLLNGTSKRK